VLSEGTVRQGDRVLMENLSEGILR
jgi:hypothetical protein